ncbi:RNA pseudouridine synthase 4, mitochondrial isoform X2 [Salvia hispanica]|uniref:RNA pseudouridine synthase 4, mitochondrial isoform X2 n=1 Tax=Salvia hispanica TaxID=49212 RepID=UPI0020090CC0|nr:RNA pseudouridine synthase 4, mitochondrial isoform X2 [Salvia hispanica]
MAERLLLRQIIRRWRADTAAPSCKIILTKLFYEQKCWYTAASDGENKVYQWLILPPFNPAPDASSIGKKLYGRPEETNATALKWILKCCPHLPRSLVQKLFRLRQVRKECSSAGSKDQRPRRIGAKDLMDIGDRIFLPKSVDDKSHPTIDENQSFSSEEERRFVQSLELYKGGVGIRRSLDELAAKYLRYDCMEPPRLVHRLDRDSSGILVMGRTQLSTTVLHSVFREKTFGASNDILGSKRILHKRYWALVIGSPRRRQGSVSVPLIKVVVDNGKSERITVADNSNRLSGQHAVTDYRVIASSPSGYTWLELSPLTGRKHQLRVHCAEVLGTPIVGDYKYGRQAHKKLGHYLESASDHLKVEKDTELESGSISDEQFSLHLHCKEMVVPDISVVLQNGNISDVDSARIRDIVLRAPLPAHMQRSWDLLSSNHNF